MYQHNNVGRDKTWITIKAIKMSSASNFQLLMLGLVANKFLVLRIYELLQNIPKSRGNFLDYELSTQDNNRQMRIFKNRNSHSIVSNNSKQEQ